MPISSAAAFASKRRDRRSGTESQSSIVPRSTSRATVAAPVRMTKIAAMIGQRALKISAPMNPLRVVKSVTRKASMKISG